MLLKIINNAIVELRASIPKVMLQFMIFIAAISDPSQSMFKQKLTVCQLSLYVHADMQLNIYLN